MIKYPCTVLRSIWVRVDLLRSNWSQTRGGFKGFKIQLTQETIVAIPRQVCANEDDTSVSWSFHINTWVLTKCFCILRVWGSYSTCWEDHPSEINTSSTTTTSHTVTRLSHPPVATTGLHSKCRTEQSERRGGGTAEANRDRQYEAD